MKSLMWKLMVVSTAMLWAQHATAQRMYRCGNEFSQTPCAENARPVDVQPASGYSRQYQNDMRRRTGNTQRPYLTVMDDLKRRIASVDGAMTRYRRALSDLSWRPSRSDRLSPDQQRTVQEWTEQGQRIKDHLTQLENEKVLRTADLARLTQQQARRPSESAEDHLARLERESANVTEAHHTAKEQWMNVNMR